MPANTTYVATLTPVWTGVHVSLALTEADWSGEPAHTTGGTLEVLINGSYQYALDFKHPKLSTGETAARLDAVAIGLLPNTAYTFRIQFKRTKNSDSTEMETGGPTTETATTLDDSPPYATTGTKYFLSQSGDDSNSGQVYTLPQRSFGVVRTDITVGDEILFASSVNYSPASPSQVYTWNPDAGASGGIGAGNGVSGDATHWTRITGYNSTGGYGRAEIQGWFAEPTGAPESTWTQHGATQIYYKGGFAAGERAAIVYDIALGKQLPQWFKSLTTGGAAHCFEDNATTPGFYFLADPGAANPENQRLYVRTYDGAAPTEGQFRLAHKLGLIIANADYIIIENMDFSLCATITNATPVVDSGVHGLRLDTCTNVIIRNCKFDHAPLFINGCTKVLIENCYFNGSGVWDQWMAEAVNDPYSISGLMGWTAVKNMVLDRIAMDIEDSFQVEVRNCHTTETANFATINGPSNTCGFVYIHDCRGSKLFDEFIECDTTIIYPLVVANCRVQDTHNFTSFSPGTEGIAWILNSEVIDALFPTFKCGGSAPTASQMRVEFVNCTDYRSRDREAGEGADEMSFMIGIAGDVGNTHWTNCVSVVNSTVYVFYCVAEADMDGNKLTNCAIWNLGSATSWRGGATTHDNFAALDGAIADSAITFTSLTIDANPMPGGAVGGVKSSLRQAATAYHGVTNMAVDGGGRREPSSPRLGAFGGALAYSGRDQEQLRDRLIRMSIAWLALFLLPAIASAGGKSDHAQHDRARLGHVDSREAFVISVEATDVGTGARQIPESISRSAKAIGWNGRREYAAGEAVRELVVFEYLAGSFVDEYDINHAVTEDVSRGYGSPVRGSTLARLNIWNTKRNSQIGKLDSLIEPHPKRDLIRLGQVDGACAVDDKRLISATSRSEQHNGNDGDSSHSTPLGLVGDGQ